MHFHRPRAATLAIALGVLALSFAASGASASADPEAVVRGPAAARIDSFMTAAGRLGMSGTLLVERDGEVILHKGYGVCDRATGAAPGTHTPYVIGSLSKQFTAAAIYRLQEAGRLHVTDSLARWFPGAPRDKRRITLQQLLQHTSGLPYQHMGSLFDTVSADSLARELLGYPLSFTPGERYQYSNGGYNLLGLVVERASGTGFEDYMRTRIFGPAGMKETGFVDEAGRWQGEAATPSYSGGDADSPPLLPVPVAPKMMGDGSIVSTTGDMWKWEQALRANTVLDTASTRALFAPGPVSGAGSRYAGGWQVVQSQRNTTVIMHAGDLGGFNADMRRMIDERATLIFLSNVREGGRGYREVIPFAVTRILFGPQPEMPPPPARLSDAALRGFTGRWQVGRDVWVSGVMEADAVRLRAESQPAISALAGSDSAGQARELELDRLAAGVADTLLHGSGAELDARFDPSLVPGSHGEMFSFWKSEMDSLGGEAKIAVLGTSCPTAAGGRSFVRLTGPRGVRVLSLDWVRKQLIGSERVRAGGLELEFFPESESTLTRYDLWAGRLIRVKRTG